MFLEEGYRNASVARIVAEAGSSTGSLYHHFGGKAELFDALWQEHYSARRDRVRVAVRLARASGQRDSLDLFCVGSRAYRVDSWERREVGLIFLKFDGPPGFETLRSELSTECIQRNAEMLDGESKVEQRVTLGVVTQSIAQAAREAAATPLAVAPVVVVDVAVPVGRCRISQWVHSGTGHLPARFSACGRLFLPRISSRPASIWRPALLQASRSSRT